MTKAEAKRRICGIASAIIGNLPAEGADCLSHNEFGEEFGTEDYNRMVTACCELAVELARRGSP